MIRNNSFEIVQINSEAYLYPIGQSSADRLNVVALNDDGLKIWNLLEHETSVSEIVATLSGNNAHSDESVAGITAIVTGFLHVLRSQSMLIERESLPEHFNRSTAEKTALRIADANICIKSNFNVFSDSLSAFAVSRDDSANFNQFVTFEFGFPKPSENGTVIIRNTHVTIMDLIDKYILLYHEYTNIREVHISKDYRYVSVFATGIPGETLKSEFSLVLRDCVLMMLRERGFVMLHSSSILYDGKLYCFSAASGTGKSTHTSLWNRIYDVPVINGDLNLLGLSSNEVTVYGTPWCGTSGIYSPDSYPLGGVIFLSRSDTDTASKISLDEAMPQFIKRITTPYYTGTDFVKTSKVASFLAPNIQFYRLSCTMNEAAVDAVKSVLI